MTDFQKPLPNIDDPVTAPFWRATSDHKLVIQKCPACGELRWPPRPICPQCLRDGTDQDWTPISDEGSIWSFIVYHRAFNPGFADDVPYNVAFVKLDAGPVLVTNIVGTNDLKIGQRVKAHYADAADDITLVKFRLLDKS